MRTDETFDFFARRILSRADESSAPLEKISPAFRAAGNPAGTTAHFARIRPLLEMRMLRETGDDGRVEITAAGRKFLE